MATTGRRISIAVVCFAFGCSSAQEGEEPAGDPEKLLGFERATDWSLTTGGELLADADSSQGLQALRMRAFGRSRLKSQSFKQELAPSRISVDVRIPEQQLAGVGKLGARLHCPSRGILGEEVEATELDAASTGRFETLSFAIPAELRDRLAGGCEDLSLEFELDTSRDLGEIAFDRVQLGSHVAVIPDALCGMQQPNDDGMQEQANGYLRRHSWRSGASVQEELGRLRAALDSTPGVLGLAVDDAKHRFIAVTDPEAPATLASIAAALQRWEPSVSFAVQPSCRTGSELSAALEVIDGGLFHPRAKDVELAHYLDVDEGRYVVYADPDDTDVGDALAAALGSLVDVRYERVVPHDRVNDGEPHYGAANLENLTSGGACTAGFVVDGPSGRGAVTAGHCFNLGEDAFSGTEFYGVASKFPTDTNAWDMVYIKPDGETFSPKIHTTPCCPSVRTVVSKTSPVVTTPRQLVCISGRNFLAKCSVEVIQLMTTKTIDGKNRKNVWIGQRTGVNIAKQGDSGAPLYIPLSMDRASIVGMHIAGFNSAPFDQTWFHSVGDVLAQLGVTLAL